MALQTWASSTIGGRVRETSQDRLLDSIAGVALILVSIPQQHDRSISQDHHGGTPNKDFDNLTILSTSSYYRVINDIILFSAEHWRPKWRKFVALNSPTPIKFPKRLTNSFPSDFWQFQSNGHCQDTCKGQYAYGIIQGKNCFCSNFAPYEQVDISRCNSDCPGFPSEKCGNQAQSLFGYYRLDMSPSGTLGSPAPAPTPVRPFSLPLQIYAIDIDISLSHHTIYC